MNLLCSAMCYLRRCVLATCVYTAQTLVHMTSYYVLQCFSFTSMCKDRRFNITAHASSNSKAHRTLVRPKAKLPFCITLFLMDTTTKRGTATAGEKLVPAEFFSHRSAILRFRSYKCVIISNLFQLVAQQNSHQSLHS